MPMERFLSLPVRTRVLYIASAEEEARRRKNARSRQQHAQNVAKANKGRRALTSAEFGRYLNGET